jgi:hypothetical protein
MAIDTALINSKIDIRQIVESAGVQIKYNRCRCPVHGGDNPTAFEIFDNGKAWNCHTREECNRFGHDGIGLLRALNNWTFSEVAARYDTRPLDPKEAARRAAEHAKQIEKELQEKIEQAQKAIEELRKARRWIEDHDSMTEQAVAQWEQRGVPECWQSFFWFGYRESFGYNSGGNWYTSPTLTIPIFNTTDTEPINVRHRILNPADPQDKYRPERAGLEATPFLGDRTLPIDAADRVIIVEGEIKAAVTFLTLDRPAVQIIGIPGKNVWSKLAPQLEGRKDTVILLDPDAKAEAVKMARSIGGAKVADLPEKIDDMIVNYGLGREWLESVFHNARMVV